MVDGEPEQCRASSGAVDKFNTRSKLNNTQKGSIKSKGLILPNSRSNHTDTKGGTCQHDHAC